MARDRARGGQAGGGAGPRSSAGGRAALAGPSRGSRSAPGVYTLSFRHGIKFQAAPEAPGAGRRPGRGEELERDLRPRGADVQAPRGWAQLGPRAGGGGQPSRRGAQGQGVLRGATRGPKHPSSLKNTVLSLAGARKPTPGRGRAAQGAPGELCRPPPSAFDILPGPGHCGGGSVG